MMNIKYVFFAIFVTCLTGCQTRYQSPKERSYLTAIQILRTPDEQDMIYKIKSCDDVDALRIIAFTASVAAWPMEAGSDMNFDNKMEGVEERKLLRPKRKSDVREPKTTTISPQNYKP